MKTKIKVINLNQEFLIIQINHKKYKLLFDDYPDDETFNIVKYLFNFKEKEFNKKELKQFIQKLNEFDLKEISEWLTGIYKK